MARLLILEDDLPLARALGNSLLDLGYVVDTAHTLASARQLVEKRTYDLAIIDRTLPDGDGLEIVEYLHQLVYSTRTLVLSRRGEPLERISGLQHGADEYLPKPISLTESLIRIRKLLNAEKLPDYRELRSGAVVLLPDAGVLKVGRKNITLRRREVQILELLLKHKNQVVTRDLLVERIWSGEADIPTHSTIDVYVRRLRLLMDRQKSMIKTVRGFGYLLRDRSRGSGR